eukprot:s3868_g1.t1
MWISTLHRQELQFLCQRRGWSFSWKEQAEGPSHLPTFRASAVVHGVAYPQAQALTKNGAKDAERGLFPPHPLRQPKHCGSEGQILPMVPEQIAQRGCVLLGEEVSFSTSLGGCGSESVACSTHCTCGETSKKDSGRREKPVKWPKGTSDKISKKFSWMKGTEWNWNSWRNVKFQKDGTFDAPTNDCQRGQCKWSANKGKVFVLWGQAGLHELEIVGETPTEQNLQKMQGLQMRGIRVSDGDRCSAVFQRVFDHEAAELDKDLYDILGLQDAADEADIKKVYRKLSIKYHPDKNPDEESKRKFAEVRDAYEILNDPDKKILYDTGGMEAVKKAEKGEIEKGEDARANLAVSLEDLYNGGGRRVWQLQSAQSISDRRLKKLAFV